MITAAIHTIDIGEAISKAPPGARYADSAASGKRFREKSLKPIFMKSENYPRVEIVLDSVEAYSAAFLKEAFGGLVREGYTTQEKALDCLEFKFKKHEGFELYARLIRSFIKEAAAQKAQKCGDS